MLNWYLDLAEKEGQKYDTVRCGFTEGERIYPDSGIFEQSHIQLAVRNPSCILGVFRPIYRGVMSEPTTPQASTELPPHANAEVHKRIMAKLDQMSPKEVFQTAVDAGIYTPDGKLTQHYAPGSEEKRR